MNSQEYYDWLNKFKKRNTSDDTFTPPAIYDAVVNYVHHHVINLDGYKIVRPFYPDGDYQAHAKDYDDKTIVIDNPPFSILASIYDFYLANNIKFFLFAPALTILSSSIKRGVSVVISPRSITYDNGAVVDSSFATNLLGNIAVKTAPQLYKALDDIEKKNSKNLPKYDYPPHVLTVSKLNKLCKEGVDFELTFDESQIISRLDNQKAHKKQLFGYGLLISDGKAKELKAKELKAEKEVICWQLSEREKQIIKKLEKL